MVSAFNLEIAGGEPFGIAGFAGEIRVGAYAEADSSTLWNLDAIEGKVCPAVAFGVVGGNGLVQVGSRADIRNAIGAVLIDLLAFVAESREGYEVVLRGISIIHGDEEENAVGVPGTAGKATEFIRASIQLYILFSMEFYVPVVGIHVEIAVVLIAIVVFSAASQLAFFAVISLYEMPPLALEVAPVLLILENDAVHSVMIRPFRERFLYMLVVPFLMDVLTIRDNLEA